MRERYLAIDPGVACIGWASWGRSEGFMCGIERPDSLADAIEWARIIVSSRDIRVSGVLAVEVPRIYPASRQKGDPNDLVNLALVAGAALCTVPQYRTVRVYPRDWKGTIPKAKHHARLRETLRPEQLAAVDKVVPAHLRHNAMDAMGLLAWLLKAQKAMP